MSGAISEAPKWPRSDPRRRRRGFATSGRVSRPPNRCFTGARITPADAVQRQHRRGGAIFPRREAGGPSRPAHHGRPCSRPTLDEVPRHTDVFIRRLLASLGRVGLQIGCELFLTGGRPDLNPGDREALRAFVEVAKWIDTRHEGRVPSLQSLANNSRDRPCDVSTRARPTLPPTTRTSAPRERLATGSTGWRCRPPSRRRRRARSRCLSSD